jgi:hypothetical protein
MVKRFISLAAGCWLVVSMAGAGQTAQQKGLAKAVHVPPASAVAMPGEIDGAVHTLSGVPIAAAAVQVLNADGSTRATLSADATGHFQIGLMAGTYTVVVSQSGYVRLRIGNIVVTAGSRVPVNFSLAVLPPTPLSGAIIKRLPAVGLAPNSSQPPPSAPPAPLAPPPALHAPVLHAPVDHAAAPQPVQQEEQAIVLHHVAPAAEVAAPAVGPATAQESQIDVAAEAQAKAAEQAAEVEQAAVQAYVKSLPNGLISYVVPLTMRLNQPVTVTVNVFGPTASASVAAATAKAAGGSVPTRVPTSNYMQVDLSQEDNPGAFAIEQEGDQSPKWVPSNSVATWTWTVTPKVTGVASLTFQTWVLYPDKAGQVPSRFDVKDETVTVTTPTPSEYLHQAWDAFLTNPAVWFEYVLPGGTGFVILVWLVGRLKKKKAGD